MICIENKKNILAKSPFDLQGGKYIREYKATRSGNFNNLRCVCFIPSPPTTLPEKSEGAASDPQNRVFGGY